MTTLYIKDNAGLIRIWSVVESGIGYEICHGVEGGTMQYKEVEVFENNSGRCWESQVELEIASRIKKQIDKGYVANREFALEGKATNAINMPKPMLAQPYGDMKINPPYFLQMKYDGNRCLITKQGGIVFAYSRNGKDIKSIDKILASAESIPEGIVLDGELYCHGVALQTIRSWIARKQVDSNNLVYMCYDIISDEPYSKRLEALEKLNLSYPITLAKTELITRPIELGLRLKEAIKEGFEGLMIRMDKSGYEDGKRSKSLIKVKEWSSTEARVIDITPSADGWAILNCFAFGKSFSVSCHGTIPYKEMVMKNKLKYIGKMVTVDYAYLTKDGVPFHPVAIAFRDGEE